MNFKDYAYMCPISRNIIFGIVDVKRKEYEKKLQPVKIGRGELRYKKDIYLIRWNNPEAGLFAYVLNILGELWYAELHGYEPVIDMQTNKNTYLEENQVGKTNAWEFYFQQAGNLTVDDCARYENVYVGTGKGMPFSPCPSVGWMNHHRKIRMWQEFAKKYLHLKADVLAYCEQDARRMFDINDVVVGVKCRGTDYNPESAKGHPIQPKVDQVIQKTHWVMKKYGCNKVYLSTEDKKIVEVFKKEFGEKLLVSESFRVNYDISQESCVSLYSTNRDNDKFLQGLEYVRDIYLLTKCTCLIGGINGGSAAALIMGEKYKYTNFWYLGRY